MALHNHERHCRNAQVRCRYFVAHEFLKPLDEGTCPDRELRLTIRPRFVGCFGFNVDCNRSLRNTIHRSMVPALRRCRRERLQL